MSGFQMDGEWGNPVMNVDWPDNLLERGRRVEEGREDEEVENAELLLLSSLCRDAACSVHPTSGGEGAFQHNRADLHCFGTALAAAPQALSSPRRGLLFHLMPPTKTPPHPGHWESKLQQRISSLGRCLWFAARTRK